MDKADGMMMPGMEGMDGMDGGRNGEDASAKNPFEVLEKMRAGQSLLEQVHAREVRAQKEDDKQTQALMDSDPQQHVEAMRMKQEHRLQFLELPRKLLRHEAQVYTDIQRTQQAIKTKPMTEPGLMMGVMMAGMHWTHILLLALGLWLIAAPFTLGYRSVPLAASDVLSGIVVFALALAAMFAHRGRAWLMWAATAVGLWLAVAPLVFWAPESASYANDTLVGALVIVFSIIIGMLMPMSGPEVPHEWSYNPSTWLQRAPILALAFLSFFLSRYMSAYQLGHITWAWDPFFGDGTVKVLTSSVSQAFPISDAGLGTFTYLIEILSGFMGDPRRWRTMPWMVGLFGIVVIPLGVVSVVLIIMQPVLVGAWCTFCLLSALFMLLMVTLSLDEVIAMLLFMGQSHKAGKSLWRTFWLGGDALTPDVTPRLPKRTGFREMFWGITLPWNLLATTALGLWLMAAPSVFGTQGNVAHSDHILGALVVTASLIALSEVGRAVRFANIVLALGIIGLPWLFGGGTLASGLNDLIVGALIIALSFSPGKIKNTYGSWNPLVV